MALKAANLIEMDHLPTCKYSICLFGVSLAIKHCGIILLQTEETHPINWKADVLKRKRY